MRPNPRETAYLVIFTEEIHNGKLHFLYSVNIGFLCSTSEGVSELSGQVFFVVVRKYKNSVLFPF